MTVPELRLQPAQPADSTLTAVLSPRASSFACFAAPPSTSSKAAATKTTGGPGPKKKRKQAVYLAQIINKTERRAFWIETYTVFASLQTIAAEQDEGYHLSDGPSASQMQYFNRISKLYCQAILKQLPLIQSDSSLSTAEKERELEHFATMNAILALAEVLYLPADGRGDGVVGEEILDWVNKVYLEPSAQEGQELSELAQPWTHPNFWPYLQRCILRGHLRSAQALLSVVGTHPSDMVQRLAGLAQDLLASFPRSTSFRVEREFLDALLRWKASAAEVSEDVRQLCEEDEQLWGEDVEIDEKKEWEDGFLWLFEVCEGREDPLLSASEDWREALAAWGLWIQPAGRRENLPVTLSTILKHHSVDSTLPSESIQIALLRNDIALVLQQCNLVSSWLVAHLADLFSKISILPSPTLRDYFILSYADVLLSDPGLWRVVVEYLVTVGPVGFARAEQVLQSVSLDDTEPPQKVAEEAMDQDGGSEKENEDLEPEKTRVVEDVLRVCAAHGMHDLTRSVCKTFAALLVEQKRYGEAVTFCVRAGDTKQIARIVDRILDEYVLEGQASFVKHVDSIPTSLLRPIDGGPVRMDDSDGERDDIPQYSTPSAPHPGLSFLARYRDFFALYAREGLREAASLLVLLLSSGIAPKRFYAVLFLDVLPLLKAPEQLVTLEETYELLRCLEEVTAPVSATGRDVYGHLVAVSQVLGAKPEDSAASMTERAMKQLDLLRGALAA